MFLHLSEAWSEAFHLFIISNLLNITYIFQQQLKKGVVTLTIRTRLRSPSLTPCPTPTLLSRSSSPNSNTSGGTPVPSGFEEAEGSKCPMPGPKDCIIMEVTLNKG